MTLVWQAAQLRYSRGGLVAFNSLTFEHALMAETAWLRQHAEIYAIFEATFLLEGVLV